MLSPHGVTMLKAQCFWLYLASNWIMVAIICLSIRVSLSLQVLDNSAAHVSSSNFECRVIILLFLQCFHVPYSALTMFLSTDQRERDSATAYRKDVFFLKSDWNNTTDGFFFFFACQEWQWRCWGRLWVLPSRVRLWPVLTQRSTARYTTSPPATLGTAAGQR